MLFVKRTKLGVILNALCFKCLIERYGVIGRDCARACTAEKRADGACAEYVYFFVFKRQEIILILEKDYAFAFNLYRRLTGLGNDFGVNIAARCNCGNGYNK